MTPTNRHTFISDATVLQGRQALEGGKVGCIVLAGGVGSRFGLEKPKGTFAISAVKHKSLFELIVDRVKAAGASFGTRPPLAIMTSEATHKETVDFFTTHAFFGLKEIFFFQQESLPQINDNGEHMPTTAPDGNGKMFWNLQRSGTLTEWRKRGIEYVSTVVIDNPLADPFDTRLIGFHVQEKNEATCVGILREDPEEKLGVFQEKESHLVVTEYSEIQENEKRARTDEGAFVHPIGNISFFVFNLSFIERLAAQPCTLPLHKTCKKITPQQQKELGITEPISLWKCEYFLFDVLAFTTQASILVMPRSDCFSPLKSAEDFPRVQQALVERDKKIFHKITGTHIPQTSIVELSPQFLYPTTLLEREWKGKHLPKELYIEAKIL